MQSETMTKFNFKKKNTHCFNCLLRETDIESKWIVMNEQQQQQQQCLKMLKFTKNATCAKNLLTFPQPLKVIKMLEGVGVTHLIFCRAGFWH